MLIVPVLNTSVPSRLLRNRWTLGHLLAGGLQGPKGPRVQGGFPRVQGSKFKGPRVQWPKGGLQGSKGELPGSKGPKVQGSKGPRVQGSKGPRVQGSKFKGPRVQWPKGSLQGFSLTAESLVLAQVLDHTAAVYFFSVCLFSLILPNVSAVGDVHGAEEERAEETCQRRSKSR